MTWRNQLILQYSHKQQTIIITLLCCSHWARGQQLNFDYYNKSNGLVNNEVHYIMQASNGFMYFGTPSGLSIFDGALFTNYDLRKGFRDNMISGIQELNNEQVVLFSRNNEFYRINDQHLSIDSSSKNISIKNIYHSKSGVWYATTFSGLYIFNDGKLTKLPVNQGKSFPGVNCVMEWQDSLLIIGRSYEPVDIYNTHTWKLLASSSEKLFVRNVCADSDGNTWISSIGSGVLLLRPGSVHGHHIQFEKLPSSFDPFLKTEFRAVVADKENNHWMGTINNGLIKYNPATNEFLHITMEQGLVSNTIFSLYCDKEDNIWIGTNRGLQKLVHKNVFAYSSKQGLPADLVLDALPLPGNRIVTCGYSGVGYITKFGAKIKAWKPPLEDEYFSQFISLQKEYFGLSRRKLISLNISSTDISVKHIYPLPQHFFSMIALNNDKLLLGGDSTIFLFRNGKISDLTKDSVHHISCMTIDASGILWTGGLANTINGYALHENSNSISASPAFHYSANSSRSQNYIQCITIDNKNRIVYGTSEDGITVLSRTKNKVTLLAKINISTGLSSNEILSLLWYDDSTLLAGTGYGLDKIIFSSGSNSFYIHNINDYYNFSNSVYCIQKDEAGNILLGTESGLLKIPSVDIEKHLVKAPPVIISSIHLLSRPDSLINFKKRIDLPYNSGITIFYSSPSFTNEKNTRYVYQLAGGNQNNWSQPSSSNNVAFLNLQPGDYRFVVKTVNIFGEFSTSEASVEIIVRPAFWQRWWFNLALVVAVAALLFFIVSRRIRNIRRESALKTKITEAEMMALRAQMNPHFIFNCMNIIDGLITSNRKEEAQDFIQKFSKLIRLVLENSQYQLVPLQQDLQALELFTELEVIRSNHRFNYEFDIDKELLENDYKIPPLLLQPYVENAIVHGLRNKENDRGKLTVTIKKDRGKIKIIIEDNGIGRNKSKQLNEENKKPHQQLGMKVTGKRVNLIQLLNHDKVEFYIDDINKEEETGTRVTIVLPEHLKFE